MSKKEAIRGVLQQLEIPAWVAVFIIAWELISGNLMSASFLPPPSAVANWMMTEFTLARLSQTVIVLALAFPVAVLLGFTMGFLVSYSKTLYNSIYPLLFAIESIPSSGIAILLVVWIGIGFATKFAVVLYIGFFAVMVNTVGGLTRIKYEYVEMMQSIQASKFTIFRKLLIPNALPHIVTGLKNAAPSCVIGVVVAELFSGNSGLGFLFSSYAVDLNVPGEFAALVWMGLLGVILFGIIITIEKLLHPWYLRKSG